MRRSIMAGKLPYDSSCPLLTLLCKQGCQDVTRFTFTSCREMLRTPIPRLSCALCDLHVCPEFSVMTEALQYMLGERSLADKIEYSFGNGGVYTISRMVRCLKLMLLLLFAIVVHLITAFPASSSSLFPPSSSKNERVSGQVSKDGCHSFF